MKEYALADVMGITGLKRSQVEYLVRSGVITPSAKASGGTGEHRKFNFVDVFEFAVAGALMATGTSVAEVRYHIADLRNQHDGFAALFASPGSDYLVISFGLHDPSGRLRTDDDRDRERCYVTTEEGVLGLARMFHCRTLPLRQLLLRLEAATGESMDQVLRLRYERHTGKRIGGPANE